MKKRKNLSIKQRNALNGYLFIGIFIIGFLLVFVPAVIQAFIMSLQNTDDAFNPYFIGFDNYKWALLVDPKYVRSVVEALFNLAVNVVVINIFSLFVATLLNRNFHGKSLFRAIIFLPVVATTGVISKYINFSISSSSVLNSGVSDVSMFNISSMFESLDVGGGIVEVVIDAVTNIFELISSSGVQIVVFLAALQMISPALYEAANVEGCSAWEAFWKITFPIVTPILSVCCVYTVIDSFVGSSNEVMQRILKMITEELKYGQASAMIFMYFILVSLILALVLCLLNKITVYD